MALSFSIFDAKKIIQLHESLLRKLDHISDVCMQTEDNLNKILEDENIQSIFRQYAKEELRSATAYVSYPELEPLFQAFEKYLQYQTIQNHCNELLNNKNRILRNIELLSSASGFFSRLFASKEDKSKANAAYNRLHGMAMGNYYNAVLQLERIMNESPSLSILEQDLYTKLMDYADKRDGKAQMGDSGVERLLQKYQVLTKGHDDLSLQLAQNKEAIQNKTMQIVMGEVLEILKTIPVESLKTKDNIIRIKPLRDHGYETVADIHEAGIYALSNISGISMETARILKKTAGQYAADTQKTVHLKLNVDNQTEAYDDLVQNIYAYKQRMSWMNSCQRIQSYYRRLPNEMDLLKNYESNPYWILLEPSIKNRTSEAYQYAKETLDGDYYDDLRAVYDEPLDSPFNAWKDFEKDSIRYYGIIEEIVPGILDNGESLYGLPEELAKQIKEQAIFPNGLLCTLRHYQEWGVKYMLHQKNVLLGDEMGLGKTIQAIATMVSLKNIGADHFVVVCPAGVLPNWCKEIGKHSKLSYVSVYGPNRMESLQYWKDHGGVAITTYETTRYWNLEDDFTYSLLVVDEAHYIKNPAAKRTIHVKAMAEHAQRIILMTGTALENRVEEMISLIRIIQPELAEKAERVSYLSQAEQFRELVAPVYYRRKREDVLMELPELIEKEQWCTLLDEEKKIYRRDIFSRSYMDCRQVSWNVEDLKNSSKARRLLELIEEAKEDGRKVLVFSFFRKTLEKIKEFLPDEICSPIINGSVPAKTRQDIIDEFEKAEPGHVLISQIQAGGTGLNIQSASVVIICEPQLKPSIENQAISRAYRMGQARNVLVHRLLCENTIDERITDLLADKQYIFDQFAHESVAADADSQQVDQVDQTTFYQIVEEEIERIKKEMEQNQ